MADTPEIEPDLIITESGDTLSPDLIEFPIPDVQMIMSPAQFRSAIENLFKAAETIQETSLLKRSDIIKRLNQRITDALYILLNENNEHLIEEFIMFLIDKQILQTFEHNKERNLRNAIIITSIQPELYTNFETAGIQGLYVLGKGLENEPIFLSTNLQKRRKVPRKDGQIIEQELRLELSEGTVRLKDFFNIETFVRKLIEAFSNGLTVTFSLESIFKESVESAWDKNDADQTEG